MLDKVPYCSMVLAEVHRASKIPLIPPQLRINYIQNLMDNIKALDENCNHRGQIMDIGVHHGRLICSRIEGETAEDSAQP